MAKKKKNNEVVAEEITDDTKQYIGETNYGKEDNVDIQAFSEDGDELAGTTRKVS